MRTDELGVKSPRLLSARETLLRIPSEGTCLASGKVCYRTRKLAMQALCVARKLPTWEGAPSGGDVYPCPLGCRSWHVTHRDRPSAGPEAA